MRRFVGSVRWNSANSNVVVQRATHLQAASTTHQVARTRRRAIERKHMLPEIHSRTVAAARTATITQRNEVLETNRNELPIGVRELLQECELNGRSTQSFYT